MQQSVWSARRSVGSGVVAVVALATALALPGSSAATEVGVAETGVEPVKSVGVLLPVEDFRAIELDEARGRLYIAQGAGSGLPLVVTDLDGNLQSQVAAVTDVSDLVLGDGGATLYAARGFAEVVAIDADSLAVADVYPALDGACVTTVEVSGDTVVGGFLDCGIGSGGLLLWSDAGSPPLVYTGGPNYKPVIDASPGAPGLLVAGDDGISPGTTYVIDISGASPTIVDRRSDTGAYLRDYAISPDGTEVVVAAGSPYEHRSYRLPDLEDATVYPSGAYPVAAAWSGDGTVVAVGIDAGAYDADVLLYPRGSTTPIYAADFRNIDALWRGTLLVNHDGTRAWAVSYDDVYQQRRLLHSFGPGHAPDPPVTDLAVSAVTGSGKDKKTAFITVTWSSPISTPVEGHYWWITASTDGGPEVEFWRGKMDASGIYQLTYQLPKGTTTLTVRYRDYWGWYPDGYDTAVVTR